VTISDAELEAGLRTLRTRADDIAPPPFDLPELVRDRHRSLRRREFGLAAAALVTVLVLVGVPVVSSTIAAGDRGRTAAPSEGTQVDPVPTLAELPTRGSLAGDVDFLDKVRRLSWLSIAPAPGLPQGTAVVAHDPPVESRRVAFAGDVPGARVALVLGLDSGDVDAWFIGPVGATPDQMVLASSPRETTERHPLALMDAPDPASGSATFVVVAWPGDEVTLLTGRTVDAAGKTAEHRESVLLTDGAGAIAPAGPPTWPLEVQLWVKRNSGVPGSYNPQMTITDRALGLHRAVSDVADPRGLRDSVRDEDVQSAVAALAGYYGTPAEDLRPTLLAGGPLAAGSPSSSVLVGVTFPSGATTAALAIIWENDSGPGLSSQIALTEVTPAGTALLDRVFAVPSSVPGSIMLTVSGPTSAALAVVHSRDGTLIARLPLLTGAGTGAVTGPLDDATVRLFDGSGSLLATAPITGPVAG
jgi:hypothetical protein